MLRALHCLEWIELLNQCLCCRKSFVQRKDFFGTSPLELLV